MGSGGPRPISAFVRVSKGQMVMEGREIARNRPEGRPGGEPQGRGCGDGGEFPVRYLAYYGGIATEWFARIMSAFLSHVGEIAESMTLVVQDSPGYRRACKIPLDPRIRLVAQQEGMHPFQQCAQPDGARLVALEERYGLPHLWRYILAESSIDHLTYAERLAFLQAHLEYFESLYEQHRPQAFITGAPDALPFMAALEVFKRNGAMPLVIVPARIPGRFFVGDDVLEHIPMLVETYQELSRRDLTQDERQAAWSLRDTYRIHRVRPSYYRTRARLEQLPSFTHLITHLRDRLRQRKFLDYRVVRNVAYSSAVVRLRIPVQRLALRRLSHSGLPRERFFYFPLHFEPESALTIHSPYVRDQYRAIRKIVAALPAGYVLCVKEHPNMFPESRPVGFYARLSKLGPVHLLSPSVDSYEVVAGSQGVITIASTTGWEALCCGKPVLLLGRAFYENFPEGVERPGGFVQIAEALQRMITFHGVPDGALERFIVATLARAYPGAVEFTSPNVHDRQNIETVAHALAAEIHFRLGRRRSCPAV